MKMEAFLGTVFEVMFAVSGSYETVCTVDCGHGKQGMEEVGQRYGFGMENEAEEARQWYDFGTENEADFCGTNLVL